MYVMNVAPLAGAWIEICLFRLASRNRLVAPLAGAWIEIFSDIAGSIRYKSLPSRERGLKWSFAGSYVTHIRSLPSRERGLKSNACSSVARHPLSLPSRERGLKLLHQIRGALEGRSLPSRERGLKYGAAELIKYHDIVAPLAGAWIEIRNTKQSG